MSDYKLSDMDDDDVMNYVSTDDEDDENLVHRMNNFLIGTGAVATLCILAVGFAYYRRRYK